MNSAQRRTVRRNYSKRRLIGLVACRLKGHRIINLPTTYIPDGDMYKLRFQVNKKISFELQCYTCLMEEKRKDKTIANLKGLHGRFITTDENTMPLTIASSVYELEGRTY